MSKVIFTTIKSNSDNRKLKKDENGYYYITLGALNIFNSANQFYKYDDAVKDLFLNSSSVFNRRLKAGYLKGELGHPKLTPGMTREEYFARNLRILETNVCAHIKEVVIEETDEDSGFGDGSKIIRVSGWVKPSGPHAAALERDLENPDVNVAFSIRCVTNNSIVAGVVVKQIRQIITWDWVTEPGISMANKWTKLGIESMDICELDLEDISNGDGNINECFNCSLEDATERDLVKEIINNSKDDIAKHVLSWCD